MHKVLNITNWTVVADVTFVGSGGVPAAVQQKSARLLCTNLPQEVTDDVLSVLFQQYVNYISISIPTDALFSQIPGLPGCKCHTLTYTQCCWAKVQNGARLFRFTRPRFSGQGGPGRVRTEERLGDGRGLHIVVYNFPCCVFTIVLMIYYCSDPLQLLLVVFVS